MTIDWDSPEDYAGNPFNVTKATDLSDEQIEQMWVDLVVGGGYTTVIDPRIAQPRILLGGKGTGRTHLMRYLSAPLQALRSEGPPYLGPLKEGYVGIYSRCTGLNSGRFEGKGIANDIWADLFAYSFDLWLAEHSLDVIAQLFGELDDYAQLERKIAADIAALFDRYPGDPPSRLGDVRLTLDRLQAELSLSVNNAALTRGIDGLTITVTRGRLPFGIPQVLQNHLPTLRDVNWLYLVDEFENLSTPQQRYVQTLIREREDPTSFIVGARAFGFRTRQTLSAGEENIEGSEYAAVELDRLYFENFKDFRQFCRNIVSTRLRDAGYVNVLPEQLDNWFDHIASDSPYRDQETSFVLNRDDTQRLYFTRLHKQLVQYYGSDDSAATQTIKELMLPAHPLLERLNVFLLYQAWARGRDLNGESAAIRKACKALIDGETNSPYASALKHHGSDLLARMLREYDLPQRYTGLDTFIRMAGGLPRNLLVILKSVVRAAEFRGEEPFGSHLISASSQRTGVLHASEWFFRDSKPIGEEGVLAERAVSRLATLMRALRYSDKPPEVDLSTFSLDVDALDDIGRLALNAASDWSILREIRNGQRDKNTGALIGKYQLNPMLCPRWDLPLVRRGVLGLAPDEARAIFSEASSESFEDCRRVRLARSNAPFGRKPRKPGDEQTLLDLK
jgi:hypothetical protein